MVVCCRRGEEILFPNAVEYYYEWECPFKIDRPLGVYYLSMASGIADLLGEKFPGHRVLTEIYAGVVEDFGMMEAPRVGRELLDVLVVPSDAVPDLLWTNLINSLSFSGLSVGVGSLEKTSVDSRRALIRSWESQCNFHQLVRMILGARLYVSDCRGLSHLANALGSRMAVIRNVEEDAVQLEKSGGNRVGFLRSDAACQPGRLLKMVMAELRSNPMLK